MSSVAVVIGIKSPSKILENPLSPFLFGNQTPFPPCMISLMWGIDFCSPSSRPISPPPPCHRPSTPSSLPHSPSLRTSLGRELADGLPPKAVFLVWWCRICSAGRPSQDGQRLSLLGLRGHKGCPCPSVSSHSLLWPVFISTI